MDVLHRAGLALAVILLACGQARGGRADVPADHPPAMTPSMITAVQADADLSGAAPVELAASSKRFKPSYLDRPCSFVPSKNPVKPKRNACRFV